jgi:outer membrane protein OmpA-like peptidoglycan-associated protein
MTGSTKIANLKTTLVAAAVASILAACVSPPVRPAGAAEARARLTQLQSDPALATRAPLAIQAADTAVSLAEQPETDQQLIAYRIYIADRKVDTARADAETRFAEDQRSALREQSDQARLDARTREVGVARNQAAVARAEGAKQKLAADTAQGEANAANLAAANSDQQAMDARNQVDSANLAAANSNQQAMDARNQVDSANLAAANSNQQAVDARNQVNSANLAAANSNQQALDAQSQANSANLAAAGSQLQAEQLQQRIAALQARPTARGLVVTLGSVLFSTGGSALNEGGSDSLNRLVVFLDQYPERTASIEGYTDNTGTAEYNQALSRRRADAVMSYLIGQGVRSDRLTASGRGEGSPVASNDSASGRQQNRRVEVIINNPTVALR